MVDRAATDRAGTAPPRPRPRTRAAAVLHLLALWLWIGFAGGALVLLRVAVPLEARLRTGGSAQGTINVTLSAVALGWAVVALALAVALARRLRGGALVAAHTALIALCAVVFGRFLHAGSDTLALLREPTTADRFVFGSYPGTEQFRALKHDGFSGVVSLMSDLVPFEAVLIARERAAARDVGIAYVHIPMLPWVTSNAAALDSLRSFARRTTGRWYVHCYLGRHRVELARFAMLEAAGAAAPARVELPDRFERGPLVRVDSLLVLGPLPTRDEWFAWIVPSATRRVIAMLDPSDRGDAPWVAQERALAADAGITLIVLPVHGPADARAVADSVRAARGKVYVHGFGSDRRVDWAREALRHGER